MDNKSKEKWANKFYKHDIIQKIRNEEFLAGFQQHVNQVITAGNSEELILAISFCHKLTETLARIIIEYTELYENAENFPEIKDYTNLTNLSLDCVSKKDLTKIKNPLDRLLRPES